MKPTVGTRAASEGGADHGAYSARSMIFTVCITVASGVAVGLGWTFLGGINALLLAVAFGGVVAGGLGLLAAYRFPLFVLVLLALRSAVDGFGVDSSAPGGLAPSTMFGAVFVGATAAWSIARWRLGTSTPPSSIVRWGAAFVGSILLSIPFSVSPATSATQAVKVIAILGMVYVLEQLLADRPERLGALLVVVLISLVVPFIMAMQQLSTGQRFSDQNIDVGRVNASFNHPNALATFTTICLAYLVGVIPHVESRLRHVLMVGAGSAAALLLFSYARAAWLGAVVAMVVIGLLQDRRILLLLGAGVLVLIAAVPSVTTRLSDLNDDGGRGYEGNSLAWRVTYWEDVWDGASDHRLMGTGLGTTPLLHEEQLDVHNSILQSLVEVGVLGFASFGMILVSILRTAGRALRRARPGLERGMVVGSAAAAANVGIQLVTENHLTAVAPLWYLAIGLAWMAVVAARPKIADVASDDHVADQLELSTLR